MDLLMIEEEQLLERTMDTDSEEAREQQQQPPAVVAARWQQLPPPPPPSPEMMLSLQEEDWGWDLIQHVEGIHNGMDPLSDFEYATLALLCRDKLEEAERRIRGTQCFKELYNVLDTVEQGMWALERFIQLQPGVLLSVEATGTVGSVVVWNCGAFVPDRAMESEENFRIHALSAYYLTRIHTPTLQAAREGVGLLIEGSMEWENFDMTFIERLHGELLTFDLLKFKQIMVYNTNSVSSVAYGSIKSLMTEETRRSVMLGCRIELFPDDPFGPMLSLQDVYIQPPNLTYDKAMQNLLSRARSLLEVHYQHQETYRLSANS